MRTRAAGRIMACIVEAANAALAPAPTRCVLMLRLLARAPAALLLLASACGDGPSTPPEPSVRLAVGGPSWHGGELHLIPGDPHHVEFRCRFRLDAEAVGDRPARLLGASWQIVWAGAPLGDPGVSGTISSFELGRAFGRSEIPAGERHDALLSSYVITTRVGEELSRLGAHRARWSVAYHNGVRVDSAAHTVHCTPPRVNLTITVKDERTDRPAAAVEVRTTTRVLQTDRFGRTAVGGMVSGEYTITLSSPRHETSSAPLLALSSSSEGTLHIRRTAPDLDLVVLACGDDGRCAPAATWFDPAGPAALPLATTVLVRTSDSDATLTLADSLATTLDDGRRRYVFPTVPATAVHIRAAVASASGRSAVFECEPAVVAAGTWRCWEPPTT